MRQRYKVWRSDLKIFLKDDYTPYNWLCNSFGKKDLEFLDYTNVLDKHGNEITEGDFLKIELSEGYEIQLVTWEEGGFCIGSGFWIGNLHSKYYEIIGNKFINPELMEKVTK